MVKTITKSNLGGKGFFGVQIRVHIKEVRAAAQGRSLKVGTEAEAIEREVILSGLISWLARLVLRQPRTRAQEWHHPQ